jgi:aspartate/methionine/tyrosine aminotransferase
MTTINERAKQLNEMILEENQHVYDMLSEKGKRIYFPQKGILSQTKDATGKKINATIGTALEDDGSPMCLDSLWKQLKLAKKNVFSYAPSHGRSEIRNIWKEMLFKKNPSLVGKEISLPIVTSALTHGLFVAAYLFCEENDIIISPDLYWENYDLIFTNSFGGKIITYPIFTSKGFNVDGLKNLLENTAGSKKIIILNFPNNPTGYTVTYSEALQIRDVLISCAEKGNDIVVFIDDAYFGLVYDEGILKESIFCYLSDLHKRILCIKFDGPTKEDYVWGFRVGFVTFGIKNGNQKLYSALEEKLAGAIRGSISNASNLGQSLLLTAYNDPLYEKEKQEKYQIMKERYQKIKNIFNTKKHYNDFFYPLPFNSGYFMCVRIKNGNAEAVRQKLLDKYDTGVIAFNDIIRIAFSSTPCDLIEKMLDNIYDAAREIENINE